MPRSSIAMLGAMLKSNASDFYKLSMSRLFENDNNKQKSKYVAAYYDRNQK